MKAKTPEPAVTPDFLRELKALQADYERAEQMYIEAKKEAATLKKDMELEKKALLKFIREAKGEAPLFEREGSDE